MAPENDRSRDRDDALNAEHAESFRRVPEDRPADDTDNWLDAIGPEDLSRDRVIENLEAFGFDLQDDDDELSLESDDQAWGEGYANGAYTDIEEVGDRIDQETPLDADEVDSLRPTEDTALDELGLDDDRLDDAMPTGDTQPSGIQPNDED
jgi:hypothetical protein